MLWLRQTLGVTLQVLIQSSHPSPDVKTRDWAEGQPGQPGHGWPSGPKSSKLALLLCPLTALTAAG